MVLASHNPEGLIRAYNAWKKENRGCRIASKAPAYSSRTLERGGQEYSISFFYKKSENGGDCDTLLPDCDYK